MMNSFYTNNKKYIQCYIFVVLYAYAYIYIFPWDSFKTFDDVENYLYSMLFYADQGNVEVVEGLSFLVSEWIWKFILLQLSNFSNTKEVLYIVSLFSLSVYSAFTFRRVNTFVVILFFFNPMFIDLILGQIRIALAFSLLLIAFQIGSKKVIPLLIIAILIHASSILFLAIYFILSQMLSIFKDRKYYFYAMILALLVALFLKFGVDFFLLALEDKRANYGDVIGGNTIKYAIFWFIVSIFLVFKSYFDENDDKVKVVIAFTITMTSLFFFSSLLGSYGQRYVAISIPLIIVSINYLPKNFAWLVFSIFFIWQLFQMFYWFNLYLYI